MCVHQRWISQGICRVFNGCSIDRAVEIPCPTCPAWSHFIQDELKISIYLSLDKYKCIKLIQFYISYFGSYLAMKTLWILISWLLQKPADLDLHCLQEKPADQDPYCLLELISDFFILFSKEHRKVLANFFLRTSKIFYGQVH